MSFGRRIRRLKKEEGLARYDAYTAKFFFVLLPLDARMVNVGGGRGPKQKGEDVLTALEFRRSVGRFFFQLAVSVRLSTRGCIPKGRMWILLPWIRPVLARPAADRGQSTVLSRKIKTRYVVGI